MAEAPKKEPQDKGNGDAKPAAKQAGVENKQMGIRLAPVENSDQPVVANYCSINVSPGMAFIDFGFLEPGMLAALPRMARSGGKLPERLNGKLAVRVALFSELNRRSGVLIPRRAMPRARALSSG